MRFYPSRSHGLSPKRVCVCRVQAQFDHQAEMYFDWLKTASNLAGRKLGYVTPFTLHEPFPSLNCFEKVPTPAYPCTETISKNVHNSARSWLARIIALFGTTLEHQTVILYFQ